MTTITKIDVLEVEWFNCSMASHWLVDMLGAFEISTSSNDIRILSI
jgi:hypothetical protein